MEQLQFPSDSPINPIQLGGQNKLVYDHLMAGKTINCIQAQGMFITALNSRISDLRNKHEIDIKDRFVNIGTLMVTARTEKAN